MSSAATLAVRLLVEAIYASKAVYSDQFMKTIDPRWRRPPAHDPDRASAISTTEQLYFAVHTAVSSLVAQHGCLPHLLRQVDTSQLQGAPLISSSLYPMVDRIAASVPVVGYPMHGKSFWIDQLMRRLAPCPPEHDAGFVKFGATAADRTLAVEPLPFLSYRKLSRSWRPVLLDTPGCAPKDAANRGLWTKVAAAAPPVLAVIVVFSLERLFRRFDLAHPYHRNSRARLVVRMALYWLETMSENTLMHRVAPVYLLLTHCDHVAHPERSQLLCCFQQLVLKYAAQTLRNEFHVFVCGSQCTNLEHAPVPHAATRACCALPDVTGRLALRRLAHQLHYLASSDFEHEHC